MVLDPFEPVRRDMERIGKAIQYMANPRSVECPLCQAIVYIPEESNMTRTEALREHLQIYHGARR